MRCLKIESVMKARMSNAFPSPRGEGGLAEAIAERGRVGRSRSQEASPHPGSLTLADPPLAGRDGTEQVETAAASIRRQLQRRFAFALRQDRGFFQIQLALQAPPRLVGDLAAAQHLVNKIALGRDQLQPQVVADTHPGHALVEVVRNEPLAMVMAGV